MAPKAAQEKVLALYKQGLSQAAVRQQLKEQGLSKGRISQLTNPWPPEESEDSAAEFGDDEMAQDCAQPIASSRFCTRCADVYKHE